MRRKSLEGGAFTAGDPLKILLRVDQLEQQVAGRQQGTTGKKAAMERKNSLPAGRSPQGKPPRSSPLKTAVSTGLSSNKRSGESSATPSDSPAAVRSSKIVQDLEQCVVELELVFNSNKVLKNSILLF